MDTQTTLLAFNTGVITLGEALAILVPAKHDRIVAYPTSLKHAFHILTGMNADDDFLEYFAAAKKRHEWIKKQQLSHTSPA